MARQRIPLLAATLSVLGFVGWLSLSDPASPEAAAGPAEAAEPAEAAAPPPPDPIGSAEPCAAPIGWHLADIDPRFGLGRQRAQAAVERAIASWERAAGRPLFTPAPDGGLAIRFVFDERQASAIERQRLERNLADVDDRLLERRRAIEERAQAYDIRRALYEGRARELERRMQAHRDSVGGWNARGGAPPDVAAALQAAGMALDREGLELTRVTDELGEVGRALQADVDELNARVDERSRRVDALEASMPARRIESGLYRELVGRSNGRVVALQRAIDVYRFETQDDLWLVIAHELGHALGLGHAPAAGGVMSEEHRRLDAVVSDIQPEDVALLAERCPALVSAARRP